MGLFLCPAFAGLLLKDFKMDAQGINKLIVAKKELVAWGTKAVASGASYYRRVTGAFQLEKGTYASNEILPSQQTRDFRHGTRKASGSLSGIA